MAKSTSTGKNRTSKTSKAKSVSSAAADRAAEAVGRTLGIVARTVDSLQAQHPHPVDEAREALAAGRKTLVAVATATGARATAAVKQAKAVALKTKKVAWRVRSTPTPAVVRAARTAPTLAARVKKSVTRGQKAVTRVARRLKR